MTLIDEAVDLGRFRTGEYEIEELDKATINYFLKKGYDIDEHIEDGDSFFIIRWDSKASGKYHRRIRKGDGNREKHSEKGGYVYVKGRNRCRA